MTPKNSFIDAAEVLDQLSEAVYSVDQDFNLTYVNKYAEKLWSKKRKDLLGKNIWEVFPSGANSDSKSKIEQVFRSQKPAHIQTISHVFGRWIDAKFYPTKTGVTIIFHEIHEQKMLQQQLENSEEQLRIILKNVADSVIVQDWLGKIIYANEAGVKMFGYTSLKKMLNSPHLDYISRFEFRDANKNILPIKRMPGRRAIGGEKNVHEIMQFKNKLTGKELWFSVKSTAIFDQGKAMMVITTNQDITQQKRAEENSKFLAEASKTLSSSLDYKTVLNLVAKLTVPAIADWVVIDLKNDDTIERVAVAHKDPSMQKLTSTLQSKYPPISTFAVGVPEVIRDGKPSFSPHITEQFIEAASQNREHYSILKKLGFTSRICIPLIAREKILGAITFVYGHSDRVYDFTDLAITQDLASRIALTIDNARLYSDSLQAVAVRDDFISVASHELKTPITGAKIFTEVLKQHSNQIGDTLAENYLTKMDKQLNKLSELIYDLLNISKIQAGKMEFTLKKFDFDKSIDEIIEVLQQSSGKHKIKVLGCTKKQILGDEDRIGQVVENLISNAIKYSPKGKKVVVRLRSIDRHVEVAVQDFGIGMAKTHLERIFERFYRVYDTQEKTFPGLGIGLYISSEIIKRHGGKLWVDSDLGKGSTFYFSLPINGQSLK